MWQLMMEFKHNIKREDQQLRDRFKKKHKISQDSLNNSTRSRKKTKSKKIYIIN